MNRVPATWTSEPTAAMRANTMDISTTMTATSMGNTA